MTRWPARYLVVDEDGVPIRTFWTATEARQWACGRTDMSIEVRPAPTRRELQRQMLAETEDAVF